jgi:hypothetical protein
MTSVTKKGTPIKERLLANSEQQGECRVWTSRTDKDGYGVLTVGSMTNNTRKVGYKAHKAAYEAYNGDIPEGMLVRHTCDNRPCINHNHLIIGTNAENSKDMVERGRCGGETRTAEQRAKISAGRKGLSPERITKETAILIKNKLASGLSVAETAKLTNVSYQVVSPIAKGINWKKYLIPSDKFINTFYILKEL